MSRAVHSVVALDESGELGFRITPEEFGFYPHTIDALCNLLGCKDRRHVLVTLFRLRTASALPAVAQRFRIDVHERSLGFPATHLYNPDPSVRIDSAIDNVALPEPLVEHMYPDLGSMWNVARRLVATVPVWQDTFYIAVLLRIDGFVLATSRSPRDRQHDSAHNLRDIVGAPPSIPGDATTVPHYVGPQALRGAAQMLTPSVEQSEHSQQQSAIIARILQPAADCHQFCESFALLKVKMGIDRHALVGMMTLICLGWNLARAERVHPGAIPHGLHPSTVFSSSMPSPAQAGSQGDQHAAAVQQHPQQYTAEVAGSAPSRQTTVEWPRELLFEANAATVKVQSDAVRGSGRCAFCGNVHRGSSQKKTHCEMFEHHPLYDPAKHFAMAYLVTRGRLQPSSARRHPQQQ